MNAVTFLLVYAVTLSWLAPVVLPGRKTGGMRPVLAVAAWMGAIVTCLGAWLAALMILVVGLVHSVVDRTALTFCVQALGSRADRAPACPAGRHARRRTDRRHRIGGRAHRPARHRHAGEQSAQQP
ncbi:hypothetical protein [Mycolicibacterium sp. HK-90]|uniref:hypothetical protein n=1 Tax=Mycolicibacterium sp. HK-90 TaxID=3056937 RepID=UPI00265AAA15|nr:hypothetical protein [Mycolicibacterium sp. HK-90]WKG04949.1 hypothetical protein QU592_07625 [Mycolicibacterium sp. HK-90]